MSVEFYQTTTTTVTKQRFSWSQKPKKKVKRGQKQQQQQQQQQWLDTSNQLHTYLNQKVTPVKVSLDDLEDLIGKLSAEELAELSEVDPDDSSLPASMRCIYKCEKESTGKLNRNAMLGAMKEDAVKIPDKEEVVPFVPGTTRGRKYVPKVEEAPKPDDSDDEEELEAQRIAQAAHDQEENEYTQLLDSASIEDIIDIADILGVAYQDHCAATPLKKFPEPAPNDTNVDEVIKMVAENNPDCMEINFNNLKGISQEKWQRFFEGLRTNKNVELLTATNCDITDTIGDMIAKCLEGNSSLKFLTLDSNSISGEMVVKLIRATISKKALEELRVSNQMNCRYLGNKIESEIASLLPQCPNLVKLGITLEFRDSLNKVATQLQKNLDRRRLTEDRTLTLKLDKKHGPKIIEEKRK